MAEDVYTHGHHDSVLRSHRWRTATNSAGYLLDRLRPGDRLLDVGCGPGTITVDLARRLAPGEVVGVDITDAPLQEARARAAGVDNVSFAVADTYRLGYPDAVFDVVHAHQVCQHLTEPVAALAEMRRVCRPGGHVAVRDADYAAMTWYPASEGLDEWLRLYRAIAAAGGAEPDAGRRLHAWARAAGFTDVTSSASVWCYATDEERAWWGGLWADRVTSSTLAHRAVELGMATGSSLASLAGAWRAWAAEPDGWFAVLNGEVLCRA